MKVENSTLLENIVSLCKRRGFIYQSNDLYGGLNGVWDKGPLGTLLARNIEQYWITWMKAQSPAPLLLFDGSILGGKKLWQTSGHLDNFKDPLAQCKSCKTRIKSDDEGVKETCPKCGKKGTLEEARSFNMMFKSHLGAMEESSSECYLRPETAQSIFSQFRNIMTTNRVKIPFGIIQVGKAFRNEINPKQFLFRSREFSQMEMEFFCHPDESNHFFKIWSDLRMTFLTSLGIQDKNLKIHIQTEEERAHYAKRTHDIEYHFPFGWKELEGVAARGSYDLYSHEQESQKKHMYHDTVTNTFYLPEVIESSIGIERLILALLCEGYREEEEEGGSVRTVLRLPFILAPVQVAVLPLSKHEEDYAQELYKNLSQQFRAEYDTGGSIGKRYRRQDEIGTPFCLSIDKENVATKTVTVRHQQTKKQEKISQEELSSYILKEH